MATGIDAAFEAIRNLLQQATGLTVEIGRPGHESVADVLHILPLRLAPNPTAQSETAAPTADVLDVDFVLVPSRSGSCDGLSHAAAALARAPEVVADGVRGRLLALDISLEAAAAIFTAAALPLTVHAAYRLTVTGPEG